MVIGPTIENLRKKRAEEAALLEMLYALPTPTGGFDNYTPSDVAELAKVGINVSGEQYIDPYDALRADGIGMNYGRQRPNRGTIDVMPPQSSEEYARSLTSDVFGERRANDLFGYPQSTGSMVGDMIVGEGLLGDVGKAPFYAYDAGADLARGDYFDAAGNGLFALLGGLGMGEIAAGARGAKSAIAELPEDTRRLGQNVREFLANESGSVPLPFSSSNPVTERGAQIIDMLTSGRAGEITEQMLDMGDPVLNANLNQYLYRNYDLPMDEASRIKRAGQMSMDTKAYKGMPTYTGGNTYTYTSRGKTLAAEAPEREITAIDAPKAYYLPEKVAGFSSDSPEVADRFQSLFDRGAVYPLRVDTRGMTPIDMRGEYAGAAQFDRYGDRGSAEREAFRAAIADQNNNGVMLLNTADEGTVYIPRNPQQYRSQFARFDPRLAHLRNLSAGVAPFGLLALQPNEEQY